MPLHYPYMPSEPKRCVQSALSHFYDMLHDRLAILYCLDQWPSVYEGVDDEPIAIIIIQAGHVARAY